MGDNDVCNNNNSTNSDNNDVINLFTFIIKFIHIMNAWSYYNFTMV